MGRKNVVMKFMTNIYVKNLLMMIAIFIGIVLIVLFGLNIYTKHNDSVTVPPIKGLLIEEAASILRSSELKYEVIDSIYQTGGIPGAVRDQIPKEKSTVKRGRTIYLVVQAKTPQMIAIPELKDFSQRQAEAQLSSLGFDKVIIESVPSAYKGLVLAVEYKGQTITNGQKIPKGSVLRMIVGSGVESVQSDSTDQQVDTNAENHFFE